MDKQNEITGIVGHYMNTKMDKRTPEKVTLEEFVKLAMESGMSESDARMQANMCAILGSSVDLGQRLVEIK